MTGTAVTLLIVDDDEFVTRALERFARKFSVYANVLVAASAEAGLEVLGRERVDLIFTDLRMPGIGGHAFMEKVAEAWPAVPVVASSANADQQDVLLALQHGAVDFVQKPWTPDTLRQCFERVERWRVRMRAVARALTPCAAR